MMLATIEGLKDEIPRVLHRTLSASELLNEHLLNCYVITDYHLGMLSWKAETGADWDIEIAEQMIIRWFCSSHYAVT
jgi:hypothetical protein